MIGRIFPADSGGTLYEPADWKLCEGPYVQHMPTLCMFRIECDEEALESGNATIHDFYAILAHLCEGRPCPDGDGLVFLGRGAIAVYLQTIGAWNPNLEETPVERCPVCKEPWQDGHRCDLSKITENDVPF